MEKSIKEKNIEIAKWLGWKFFDKGLLWKDDTSGIKNSVFSGWITQELENYNLPIIVVDKNKRKIDYERKLIFNSDSNWQWLCLEKIAKDNTWSIGKTILYILNKNQYLNSKQDLFEAIYNYISNK